MAAYLVGVELPEFGQVPLIVYRSDVHQTRQGRIVFVLQLVPLGERGVGDVEVLPDGEEVEEAKQGGQVEDDHSTLNGRREKTNALLKE